MKRYFILFSTTVIFTMVELTFGVLAHARRVPVCIPPPAGLMSWWTGDEDYNDIVSNNIGTPQGGVTFAPGEVDQAFSFNGASSVFVPDSPSLEFGTRDFTIDFWLKTTQTTEGILLWKTSCLGPCQGWAVSKAENTNLTFPLCCFD
jgi:hypothetical protein